MKDRFSWLLERPFYSQPSKEKRRKIVNKPTRHAWLLYGRLMTPSMKATKQPFGFEVIAITQRK